MPLPTAKPAGRRDPSGAGLMPHDRDGVGAVVRPRGPAPVAVLLVASLGVFMVFVDATVVNIAFPDMARSFPTTSIGGLSWVLNAYNVVFAAFLLAGGRLADLLGRRRVFTVGLLVFTACSALCAAAPTVGWLIGGRVVQGLGATLLVPASLGLVVHAFGAERRAHGVALWAAMGALAAGVGPSLGGLLVAAWSWRLAFVVNVPIGAAAYLLGRRHLVESRTPGRRGLPDVAGGLLAAIALGAAVLAIVESSDWGWLSPGVIASLCASAASAALLARRSTHHPRPLVDPSLVRCRPVAIANVTTVLTAAAFYGYTLCNVLFLTGVWHYSVLRAGLALTPGPLTAVVVAGPTSHLATRIGHRAVLVAGGLIWGGSVLWFALRAGTTPDFLGVWLPGMLLLGIGAGTLFPNQAAAAVAGAPGEQFGMATALNSVSRQLGAALGVAICVTVVGTPAASDVLASFDHEWAVAAACLVAAGLGSAALGRLRPGVVASSVPSLGEAARAVLDRVPPGDIRGRAASGMAFARLLPPSDEAGGLPESTAEFLRRVPLLAGLDAAVYDALVARTLPVRLAAGEWLCRQGEPAHAMYIVRSGRLEVVADGPPSTVIRVLARGDAVGELALLTSGLRSASVRATRDTDLICIEAAVFDDVARQSPQLWRSVSGVLAGRLADARGGAGHPFPPPTTIAIVPLEEGIPAQDLAEAVAAALGGGRNACVLRRPGAEEADAGDALALYAPLLDRCERAHRQVILVASIPASRDAWTAFCLQEADRVAAVTRGGAVPEWAAATSPALRSCALVGYGTEMGSGRLAGWVERLHPRTTHVVRPGSEEAADLQRLARRLGGRSIGLVLSGGGARALCHIGVVEELLAGGLVIDRVAGVSMGAFIGGMVAMGMDVDEIDARCYDGWVRGRPLGDYTVPLRSIIKGQRATTMVRRTFGGVRIEELPLGFLCTSTDIARGASVVHREGVLWEQVAASMSLPILVPPRIRGREVLVDGSVMDNLPVTPMLENAEGPIVAVDVRGGDGGEARDRSRAPLLAETVTRLVLLTGARNAAASARHADFVIRPRVSGIGLLEYHQIDAAREAGREAARRALAGAPAHLVGRRVAHEAHAGCPLAG